MVSPDYETSHQEQIHARLRTQLPEKAGLVTSVYSRRWLNAYPNSVSFSHGILGCRRDLHDMHTTRQRTNLRTRQFCRKQSRLPSRNTGKGFLGLDGRLETGNRQNVNCRFLAEDIAGKTPDYIKKHHNNNNNNTHHLEKISSLDSSLESRRGIYSRDPLLSRVSYPVVLGVGQ